MYELAAGDLERLAGWPAELQAPGAAARSWREALAIELALAPADARGRSLSDSERASTVRRLIPWLARRLLPPQSNLSLVARLEGRLERGSLLDVMSHLPQASEGGLFNWSGGARLSPAQPAPLTCASMLLEHDALTELCNDPAVRLERAVRLRLWALPPDLVPLALQLQPNDLERWQRINAGCRLYLAPAAGLQSIFIIGPLDAEELRHRLSDEHAA